jgi:hypothetical protein
MSAAKLSAEQARKLHDADVKVKKLRAQLEDADKESRALRARYRERVPLSDKPEEAADGIRVATVGGVSIRITPQESGERFSLTVYREAGHEVTPEMQEAITPGKPFDRWTLKPAAGPKKLKAVEPT